jgi:two-component system cell cycle sensor histidine kinase/response regulator CckA
LVRLVVHALTGPHARIISAADRRGARLLAALTLVQATGITAAVVAVNIQWVALRGTPIWGDLDAIIVVAGALLNFAAYGLIRAGRHRAGALLYIATSAVVAIAAPFAPGADTEIGILATALVPVLVAAMVLSSRWTAGILGVILAAGGAQLLLTPLPAVKQATGFALLVIVAVTGILVLVFRHHFAGLEADRLAEIGDKESALRESEGKLRTLLENSRDMIIVLDGHGVPIMVGGAYERILGFTAADIIGASTFEDVHPDDATRVQDALNAFFAGAQGSQTIEWRHRRSDGRWLWLEATASNSLDVPGVHGIVVNIRDVTGRKEADEQRLRLEAQLQQAMKMESVGRLAGGVAHDFNNLLTTVLGNAEIAEESLNPDVPARAALREIRQASDRAASLTRQLLAFSRRQVLAPRVINLNELLMRMGSMLSRLIGEDVVLRTSLEPDLGSVRVDPGLVEQIVMNLAVNSRDAMPAGGTLLLETANAVLEEDFRLRVPSAIPGDYVLLLVRDTGTGMSDEVKRHAFEPFYTTKDPGKGTGLGLATTYGAVKQSEGYIDVDSEQGKGTTIRIYFPRVSMTAEKLARPEEPPPGPGRGETILLVEDEAQVRDLVIRILSGAGYRILPAADGEEALRVAGNHDEPIHLLVTDVVMPGMNGRDLADRLAAIRPGMRVLFTSGYAHDVIARHGLLEAGLSFIAKPYSPRELTRRVREVLDQGRPQDSR